MIYKHLRLLPQILALSLAVLLTSLAACKKEEGDEATAAEESAGEATADGKPAPAPSHAPAPSPADAKPASPETLPAVVAKVNGQEIKKEQFLQGVQQAQMTMAQMGQQPPQTPTVGFYRQVLDHLIAQALLQQAAKAQGVTASPEEIQKQIDNLKSRLPTPEAYQQALDAQGMTEEKLRQEFGRQIAFEKYVRTQVVKDAPVTDQAMKQFYDENQAQMQQPEQVHLRHILVRADQTSTADDQQKAKEKADGILKRIKDGEDFAKLARENSDDPGSKPLGGDLSWVARGQTVPPFEQAAFALKNPNDLSEVVQSEFGFHIIQLLERRQPSAIPFEQVKPKIGQFLKQRQAQQQVEAKVKDLRAKAKVETFL